MAGNKKPRKKHTVRFKPARPPARAQLSGERQTDVCIEYHNAIEAMRTGRGQGHHLDTFIYALAIGIVLVDQGLGDKQDEARLLRALDGARRIKERFIKTGSMGIDGPALVAIRAAYPIHEAQMRQATIQELKDALTEMNRRVGIVSQNEERTT